MNPETNVKNEFGVLDVGAVDYMEPCEIDGQRYPGIYLYPCAPLEYFSVDLTRLLCTLWQELGTDPALTPRCLADHVSGIATGIQHSDIDLGANWKAGALADLETLESVLIIRGRSA